MSTPSRETLPPGCGPGAQPVPGGGAPDSRRARAGRRPRSWCLRRRHPATCRRLQPLTIRTSVNDPRLRIDDGRSESSTTRWLAPGCLSRSEDRYPEPADDSSTAPSGAPPISSCSIYSSLASRANLRLMRTGRCPAWTLTRVGRTVPTYDMRKHTPSIPRESTE